MLQSGCGVITRNPRDYIAGLRNALNTAPGSGIECWACLNSWCTDPAFFLSCEIILALFCSDTLQYVMCPGLDPVANGFGNRENAETFFKDPWSGQVPPRLTQALDDLCAEANRQINNYMQVHQTTEVPNCIAP